MQLTQLYPTLENPGVALPSVDIVLVHGLDSQHDRHKGRIKTWTAEDGTVWPLEMLPERMPDARVLCYEYNGSIQGTTSTVGMREHALRLLQHLNELRCCGVQDRRPIIFVGHSLGGVIQAIILAHPRPLYKHLAKATCGIVFFATPHQLSGAGAGKHFATRLLRAVGDPGPQPKNGFRRTVREALRPVEPSARMIQEIETNSGNLSDITADFLAVLNDFNIFLVNFIEATVTEGLDAMTSRRDAVVSQGDASLHGADNQFLDGDHVGMCKFSKNHESEWERFRPVLTALQRLANMALGNPDDIEAYRTALLDALCTAKFHEYSFYVRPTPGTGKWIEKTPKFQAWRDLTARKLWIHGKPAAGKTYLAKHIVDRLRAKLNVEVLDCFLNARLKERNSCDAILRSTIHQIATKNPGLWTWAVDQPGAREPGHTTMDWKQQELTNLWPNIMSRAVKPGTDLAIVLDGFDEIPKEDQEAFLNCLEAGENKLQAQAQRNFRILVLSRWCSSLNNRKRGFVEYEIGEQDNARDIGCTVQKELDRFADQAEYSDDFRELVCDSVTRGAKGIYLWATIMIADLSIRMPAEHQLQRQLKKLPKSLAELYDSILGNIRRQPGDAGTMTRTVLLWVVFGLEPLELRELNLALAVAELWKENRERRIQEELISAQMIPSKAFKASLYRLCGQLLRLSATGHVQPVHSTLTEYLTTNSKVFENKEEKWIVPNHSAFHLSEQTAHRDLGRMCAAYLMMPCFADAGEEFTSTDAGHALWELKVQTRIGKHPLVRYAALCWLKHLSLAGPVQPSPNGEERDNQNQITLRDIAREYGTSWYEVWWFQRKWRKFEFPGPVADFERLMVNVERVDNALVPPTEALQGRNKTISPDLAASGDTLVDAVDDGTLATNPPHDGALGIAGDDNTTRDVITGDYRYDLV
ncbi:hypothetical protein C8A05DRAFT_17600 [Staphylotrichum tortipilum]|uniref:Uncharacterized protein n=1 Tax=Staphylotrichum tortipilum TaxID=2831512 RepID=A0AAN6RRE9_9PEZI|nr:hypothetical protein C8A05DRAFT_17600 [Staphylotrichum longicolle]